jgi:hypothetical protein
MTEMARISLAPYVTRFLAAYVLLQIVAMALVPLIHLPGGPGILIGTAAAAALVAAHKFLHDNRRPLTLGEKLRMTLYSLAVVLGLYAVRLGLGLSHLADRQAGGGRFSGNILDAIRSVEPAVMVVLVSGTTVMAAVSLLVSYSLLSGLIYRDMAKRGEW